jgi:hypothetical protein
MKYIITESQKDSAIIRWLNSEYGDLTPIEMEEYSNYIIFMKDDKVIFEYNKRSGVVSISYDNIWSILSNFFGLEDKEIEEITKEWVESRYKLWVKNTYKFRKGGNLLG